jgi:hypothetical protein
MAIIKIRECNEKNDARRVDNITTDLKGIISENVN